MKFPRKIILLVDDYLKSRKFFVNIQGAKSEMHGIEAGVPQGSILGPLLFILYITDLPKDTQVKTSVFADDTSILVSAPTKTSAHKILQKHLNKISQYYSLWKIKVNVNKTEVITFSKRRKIEGSVPILHLNHRKKFHI